MELLAYRSGYNFGFLMYMIQDHLVNSRAKSVGVGKSLIHTPNLSANSVYCAVYKIILANFFNVRAKKNHPCIALLLLCLGHPSPKSWYDRIKLIRHHLSKWFGGGGSIRRRFLKRKLQVVLMFEAAVAFFHWCGFQNCCSCWNLVIAMEEEDDDDGGIWAHP